MRTLTETLINYIAACFSGLWIETFELDEVVREIESLCREQDWNMTIWDISQGDPLSAVTSAAGIGNGETPQLIVLRNFHRFLGSIEIVQAMERQIQSGKVSRTFYIVLAPVVQISVELEKLFVVVEHPLPDKEQLLQIATEIAGELPDEPNTRRVLEAASGMTRMEAEGAFSLSLIEQDMLLPEPIWQLKANMLRQSSALRLYRAVHPHLKREVALKVIRNTRLDDPSARERFVQEMHSLGKLTHPNIVHATDAGIDGDMPFIVTELLDGQDLGSYIDQHGKMPVKLAVDCIRQAATGLAYAHKAGYVHRDIKPSNLFLCYNTSDQRERANTTSESSNRPSGFGLKILDLGIARPLADSAGEGQTQTGHVIGSPEFMAPEQFRGEKVDARSDIYSLGQTFANLLHEPIPSTLKPILARMTAGLPEQRYQTADELIQAVDALSRTKWYLLVPLLVGALLFIGAIIVGQLRKDNEKQVNPTTPIVKTEPFSPRFTADEQAEIDGYIASFVAGRGIDVHGKYEDGWTLLHSSVSVAPNLAVAKYLVSQGADVNAKNDFGATPLHLAVCQGDAEIARFLVSQGANVNARTNVNNTPLHAAVDNSNVAVTKYLVSQGADVHARNNFGKTPLDLARERGHTAVAEYLSSLR